MFSGFMTLPSPLMCFSSSTPIIDLKEFFLAGLGRTIPIYDTLAVNFGNGELLNKFLYEVITEQVFMVFPS